MTSLGFNVRAGGRALTALSVGALFFACGGERQGAVDSARDSAFGYVPPPSPSDSSTALSPESITPEMIALGQSIFKGQAAGGICYTCHGQDAKGTELAPNLTDQKWLNGDGSLQFISNTVRTGVPQPKEHQAPMPAFGQTFTPEQLNAVAAYVYSLTHPHS